MAYLYTDLDPEGAQLVTETLRGQAVPYELSPDGTAVLAPADRISELRMELAGKQIGGKIGYEVLEIGRASCRERVCQYVLNPVVAVSLKKKSESNIYLM